ncbi:MAG: hypothetical protein H7Z72_18335 [Bacteroidetes bacterium]|nr:hypothetical protein [Fibrella sp.]
MMVKSATNPLVHWLAGCLLSLSLINQATAQSDQTLLLIGANPGVGIGIYNSVGVNFGIDLRYQHPLTNNLTLIGKTGIESLRVKGRYVDQFRQEYQTATGLGIPITVGPRYYIMPGLYGGLNLGADIGITKLVSSSFRFEPGVGIVVPLQAGYLDVGTSISTSLSRGSGTFSFNVSYGLKR